MAVSSSDAVNVLACNAATKLGIPRKVARVEDPELKAEVEALGVDLVIDPGEATARDLLVLVSTGHVAELVEFADGGLVLVGAYVSFRLTVRRHDTRGVAGQRGQLGLDRGRRGAGWSRRRLLAATRCSNRATMFC